MQEIWRRLLCSVWERRAVGKGLACQRVLGGFAIEHSVVRLYELHGGVPGWVSPAVVGDGRFAMMGGGLKGCVCFPALLLVS